MGEQLPDGWSFRRALNFKQAISDAPGVDVAVAEFYCDGGQKSDASDLRITTADRTIVAHRVLQSSPKDDFVRVAFEARSDGPYYVWWGNPRAENPAVNLEIKRGVLAEVFRVPAGRKDNVQAVTKLFEQASPVGSLFVPDIFLGYNPLGEEWGMMFRFSGQFKIDKPIKADFAFTAADTGSLTIDGKRIAAVFRDKLHTHVRDPKSVELSVGWHTIEVMQASANGGGMGISLVWRRPSDRNYAPLPRTLFPAVATATAGSLEKIGGEGGGGTFAADFTVSPEAEVFSPPESYLQHYLFTAALPADSKPVITWDFGDGQVQTNGRWYVSHIFVVPGVYSVTLKLEQADGNTMTATRRITVKDRMYSRFPRPPEESGKTVAAILNTYRPDKLTGGQALRIYLFFKDKSSGANPAMVAAWGKAWLSTKDLAAGASGKVLFDETFDLARLMASQADYRGAAEAFRLASQKTGDGVSLAARLNLMRYGVMTTCDDTDDAAGALQEAQEWLRKVNENDKPQLRIVQAAILYAAIAKAGGSGSGAPDAGAAKVAQAVLEQLRNPDSPGGSAFPAKAGAIWDVRLRQGVFARNVENYIQTSEFDTAIKLLNDWELEFPDALWDGFTRILRVKLALAEKRPLVAARMALTHARANSNGVYAAELLYRASQSFELANELAQAKAARDLLASKYPESPYARGEMKEK